MTHRFIRLAAGLAAALAVSPALAQNAANYPSHPISLFVAFPAGGPPDLVARIIAPAIGEALVREHPGEHLILVTYAPPKLLVSCDWVYNSANIDGQAVVWALSLGAERDAKLIDYYRGRQVWVFDAEKYQLSPYAAAKVGASGPG